ncbi:MAG TPA: DUF177 domain-containing protein [Pyrinomonadaceae bacterium]|jgi:uncharacterized protein|nr:DUF177 domain-containing protein [Pyrinomonadaceae bacterium]
MRIEVENLTDKGEPFSQVYEPGQVELGEEVARVAGQTAVEGRASRKGEEVRVRGRIKTEVELACDRCLAPRATPLEVEFDTSFIPQAAASAETDNVELLPEHLVLATYEGDAVDLDELVREQIVLALPSRNLCREDCKGLCPRCGADLNAETCSCETKEVDPRWSALADWKNEKQ